MPAHRTMAFGRPTAWRQGWGGLVLLLLGWAAQAQAQTEPLVTKRSTELRESPSEGARSLAQLPARTPLNRLKDRSGPWVQVQVRPVAAGSEAGASGWIHMFDLGAPTAVSTTTGTAGNDTGASSLLRGVTGFFNRGSASQGSTVATSTVGVRGLSAEDLARATPNPAAVDQVETWRVDATAAKRFATTSSLTATSVAPLPVANPAPSGEGMPREGGE